MQTIRSAFEALKIAVATVAPNSIENLNPPATQEQLSEIQERVPLLPADWVEILSLHEGEEMISWISMFPNGMQLMTVNHILENIRYAESNEEYDGTDLVLSGQMDRPIGPVKPISLSKKRVPFAHINGELIWYFDFDPAPGGRAGQIIYEDLEGSVLSLVANSLDHLFEQYQNGLKNGDFFADGDNGQITSRNKNWCISPSVR